ncbi:DEAD/DEAH box helicase [Paenibacillus eucommiae]|uniref:DEAD/DEAH box helicase domain-containing protein n=1 Tax=Paenibacillus eucommiae TaxID=1355755 RepID=A0ABS4J5X8_9BACL|nr:DEAD/DEAH box helicase [Paenibacillus eucommiae]MBP1995228.1 DEAD/DEAH box helicase domain-containing protein [Paenibacillus eucommiae]
MNPLTGKASSITEMIDWIRQSPEIMSQVTYWHTIPPREPQLVDFPEGLHEGIRAALHHKMIHNIYTHQAESFRQVVGGNHVVTVTPTASGKTLCYNLPVLQKILENDSARALYLFPTKALAQDQVAELQEMVNFMEVDIKTHTYDGDTPPTVRQSIRNAGHIVVTNPDMLHSAILPHHTKWVKLFENLSYIVIDEVHSYRGVFGSHVANVIRRLKRICRFYGSNPLFICASATIDNPKEHTERLIGEQVALVNNNGAPAGEKHFVFYNPPVVNQQLGIRKSSVLETRKLAGTLLRSGIQTIVFARSRVRVEILLTYLQDLVQNELGSKSIRGYRGGYLPKLRREIESGLRSGQIRGVVSTNALELGIDIGQLQACVLNGYPGTIASTWQQSGRAGRRQESSLTILVASSNPLDQYLIQNPRYFFERPPEQARIHPDNLIILVDHVKCAAYELPFEAGEQFGGESLKDILEFLTEEQVLHRVKERWYWMEQSFPAHTISLRSAAQENFVIIDITNALNRVIGEVDRFSAPTIIHEEAIYIHEGIQFQVEKLDYEEKKAFVRQVDVDYFTDASMAVQLKVLHVNRTARSGGLLRELGEVTVNAKPTIFKKIRLRTHENVGSGPIHLPEEELHTSSYWFTLDETLTAGRTTNDMQYALLGIANVLVHIAPLYLMCDPMDIRVVAQVKAVHSKLPTVFIYDRYPGGVGLSERLYEVHGQLMAQAGSLIAACGCLGGCPACVGPIEEVGLLGKQLAMELLEQLEGGSL